MSYLIINNLTDLEQISSYELFFVDTKFTNQYFIQLLELLITKPIKVYKRTNNIYATVAIEEERKQIASDNVEYLEHYHQVDFMNNHLNQYLQLKILELDSTQKSLDEFRAKNQLVFEGQREHNKHLVFEIYVKTNKLLLADIELFHHTTDCSCLAFTTDPDKYYTYQQDLIGTDILISKSNKPAINNYLMLPQAEDYKIHQKLLYIKTLDYKQIINRSNLQTFIIDVVDELKYNQFFNQLCIDNQLKLSNQIELSPTKYNSQNLDSQLQIKLVEENGYLEIYEYHDNQLKLIKILKKNSLDYQKMVLSYKNDLFYCN